MLGYSRNLCFLKEKKKKKKKANNEILRHKIAIFTSEYIRVENEIFLKNYKRVLR